MPRPIWITPSQNISTLREGEFFQFRVLAQNAVKYQLISGLPPPGIQVVTFPDSQGYCSIEGTPNVTENEPVREIYNYNFTIRAISSDNKIADRHFSLTVNALAYPILLRPYGSAGVFVEGTRVNVQLVAVDIGGKDLVFSLRSGTLPPGVKLTSNGILTGYAQRISQSQSTDFNFIVSISDGVNVSLFDLSITVVKTFQDYLKPVILTEPEELEAVEHDNFYSFKFNAYDFEEQSLSYFISNKEFDYNNLQEQGFDTSGFDLFNYDQITSNLPNSLVLDPATGWLRGRLPTVTTTTTFRFYVGVKKNASPFTVSESKEFSLTVYPGDFRLLTWTTPSELPNLYNGMISDLSIQATSPTYPQLYYRLSPYNINNQTPIKLPQGIRLTESGLLIGRASFRYFSLDGGSTTVSDKDTTTYDETYTFTVEVRNHINPDLATLKDTKEFRVRVLNRNPVPYENVFIKALPDESTRKIYQNLVNDTVWLPESAVYRAEDPYFGRRQELKMLFIPGVEAPLLEKYFISTQLNHYKKTIILNDIEYSVATDQNFNPIYEVIYATVRDDDENLNTESTALEIDLLGKIANYYKLNGISVTKVYPNSFVNMRNRLIQDLDLENKGVLPRWMTSIQKDGSVPGPIYAVPIAYTKPGTASTAIQRLKNKIKNDASINILSKFNFEIDRYQIDNHLSKYWDAERNKFLSSSETTFDRFINEEIGLKLSAVVDYALEVPFETINNSSLDSIFGYKDPEVVSPQVFSVSHPSWSAWMNDNAVWVNNRISSLPNTSQTIERDFYVNATGLYNLTVMNSMPVSIFIDNNLVKDITAPTIVANKDNATIPYYLVVGWHTIRIAMSTGAGSIIWNVKPMGVAVDIERQNVIAFNTRINYEPKIVYNTKLFSPGLDGITDFKNGDKLIFAKQDNYLNFNGDNNGWNIFGDYYGVNFDDSTAGASFNKYFTVPGLYENSTDIVAKSIDPFAPIPRVNQRAGVWTVNIQNNRVVLSFAQEVKRGEIVKVLRGEKYGGSTLVLANEPTPPGSSELNYIRINNKVSNSFTRFDGDDTRFLDYRDLYVDPGRGDKYVMFPKSGVFE